MSNCAKSIENKITDVGVELSPDGNFQVLFQMRGEPHWSSGNTDIRVIVESSDGKVLDVNDTSIANDGKNLTGECWNVIWKDNIVEITLSGEEQKYFTYQVSLY